MDAELLMTSQLKERGWSGALIRKFLGAPDRTAKNPVFRSKSPMKLYSLNRVLEIEQSVEFQEQKSKVRGHKCRAEKAVATKHARMQEYIENLVVQLPNLCRDELIRSAVEHYNKRGARPWRSDTCWRPAQIDADPAFLDRIAVNYLRHRCTEYETHLQRIAGKVGARNGYPKIKSKILKAIASSFPWLEAECRSQELAADLRTRYD